MVRLGLLKPVFSRNALIYKQNVIIVASDQLLGNKKSFRKTTRIRPEIAVAYSKEMDNRIKAIVEKWPRMVPKKMFGGVAYFHRGHMVCGIHKDFLVVRLGLERAQKALREPHVKPFDITGRPMKGWVMVSPLGIGDRVALRAWLEQAREFVEALPPK